MKLHIIDLIKELPNDMKFLNMPALGYEEEFIRSVDEIRQMYNNHRSESYGYYFDDEGNICKDGSIVWSIEK
jgi:hypothetical protein